jgi:GTP-binding protein EngB required for normal cell division
LAYTSKTPGKTQQFNFFAVNDKPEKEREVRYGDDIKGEKDPDSFYMVDLPGFGFAKVPDKQRQEWAKFMSEYIETRKTLKVIFHP